MVILGNPDLERDIADVATALAPIKDEIGRLTITANVLPLGDPYHTEHAGRLAVLEARRRRMEAVLEHLTERYVKAGIMK